MGTITAAVVSGSKPLTGDGDNATIIWEAIGDADTGTSVSVYADFTDRTIHVFGTFGSATITVQGSIDGTNWATLTDPQGNALTFTSARIEAISEATPYIRCTSSGGTGTDVDALLYVRRGK